MVDANLSGQQLATFVRYQPTAGDPPFECSTIRRFRALAGPTRLQNYERVRFDVVIAPTQGRGTHDVDFETFHLDRHHWLYIRAGQAHRWGRPLYEADLILLQPAARTLQWQPEPGPITFTDAALADVEPLLTFAKVARANPDPVVMDQTRQLLFHWLRLGRSIPGDPLVVAFLDLLDVRAVDVRDVAAYAALIGCPMRELVRACRAAGTDHPQKLIDSAVVLEAKRLLAQPNGSVPVVASFLGFDESQFRKFFKRTAGQKVDKWTDQHLRQAALL